MSSLTRALIQNEPRRFASGERQPTGLEPAQNGRRGQSRHVHLCHPKVEASLLIAFQCAGRASHCEEDLNSAFQVRRNTSNLWSYSRPSQSSNARRTCMSEIRGVPAVETTPLPTSSGCRRAGIDVNFSCQPRLGGRHTCPPGLLPLQQAVCLSGPCLRAVPIPPATIAVRTHRGR